MIINFYSYKGGVGRSMALANVAALFARAGLRVLVVDCDLEAPGIETYLASGPTDEAQREARERLTARPGFMDLLYEYKKRAAADPRPDELMPAVADYLSRTDGRPASNGVQPGAVTLLTSGDRGAEGRRRYTERVNAFNWYDFYKNWFGGNFMEAVRQELNAAADVVFIDTRTGVTELGDVCTHELADLVVALCAANDQNVEGTRDLVNSLQWEGLTAKRTKDGDRERRVEVLVVPARVELLSGNPDYAVFARRFETEFAHTIPHTLRPRRNTLIDLAIPYVQYHAFRERLAVPPPAPVPAKPADTPAADLLTLAYHRLAGVLTEWLIGRLPDGVKEPKPPQYYIEAAPEDLEWAAVLQTALERDGDRVSLGLYDAVLGGEPLADGLRHLRDKLHPPEQTAPTILIQLIDPVRDVPHRRWLPAESVSRATVATDQSRKVIRIALGPTTQPAGEPARDLADVIPWPTPEEYPDVVKKFREEAKPLKPLSPVYDRNRQLQDWLAEDSLLTTDELVRLKLDEVKKQRLQWDDTTGSARKWWEAFETENKGKLRLVLRLARELASRSASITEFFLAYVYSNTDNIEANLYYLDYTRLKKEEERKKRAKAAEELARAADPPPPESA